MSKVQKQTEQAFAFSSENLSEAKKHIAKYPAGRQRSAVLPLLDLAQRQNGGWLSLQAMDYVAEMLELPHIKVYEVASFYSMFNLEPVGKHLVQVCRTTPCWLRGSDNLTNACKKRLGIDIKETTGDGNFTLVEVECLGACVNAPMVQINDDYFEDLTPDSIVKIIDDLAAGKKVQKGSQVGRQCSSPLTKGEVESGSK